MPRSTSALEDAAPASILARASRLRAAHCFGRLPGADTEKLVREARVQRLAEGEPLWRAGAPGAGFALVQEGLVLIAAPRADGERAVLGLFGAGECVGIAAALDGSAYPADAIAFTRSVEVLWIPSVALRSLASASPAVARAIQHALLAHTQALRVKIEILSAGKVPARIASLLLHLGERFGTPLPGGAIRLELPVSRQAIAELVSARTETVIRCLTRWKRAGAIDSDPRGFTLRDREVLHLARGGLDENEARRVPRVARGD